MNIDLHFHHTPRFFLEELSGANPWGKSVHGSGDALAMRIGSLEIPLSPEHWDVGRTLAVMDARRIDVAAISPSPLLFHTQWPAGLTVGLHRRVNDHLADIARGHSDRFAPLGTVPLQVADLAVVELERCMEIGLSGIEIETHAAGRNLDDPALRPLFAAAERLRAVILLHPLAVLGADRLMQHYLTNLIGNPTDTAVAVASLIFGGVVDEFPGSKIVCAHGGGSTPYLCGRWDRGARVRPELAHLKRLPSESVRGLYFDSLTHSADSLELLVKVVGADRVVLGSDYPYDMGDERAVTRIETAGFLDTRAKRLVLGETARALLERT